MLKIFQLFAKFAMHLFFSELNAKQDIEIIVPLLLLCCNIFVSPQIQWLP